MSFDLAGPNPAPSTRPHDEMVDVADLKSAGHKAVLVRVQLRLQEKMIIEMIGIYIAAWLGFMAIIWMMTYVFNDLNGNKK